MVVSQALVECFDKASLTLVEVPAQVNEMVGATARAAAKYSDHLPLVFTLKL